MIKNIAQALADPRLMRAAARKLAAEGVHGDTILAHINPEEAALLKAHGGVGTSNTRSSLPQFYDTGGGSDAEMGKDMGSSGGAGGSAAGGMGGEGGGYGAGVANNGLAAHNALDDAAVAALGPRGYSTNAASSAMQGKAPSFSDKVADFFGQSNPGGFFGSNAVLSGAGLIGGLIGGPLGSAAASGLTAAAQGRGLGASLGAAAGGGLGFGASTGADLGQTAMNHGADAPASEQNTSQGLGGSVGQTQGGFSPGMPDTGMASPVSPDTSAQTAALIKALGPEGSVVAQDPTRTAALLISLRNRSQSNGQQQFQGSIL